ncbi:MAG: outer membrane beta-barrel protein [Bacteroidetes bacterium]|uniref:Outer membrane beta-barrel protein n=1 Tax=Candidatus Cryptobacteroides excrementipullorum TaxID=2840761 RepID=A0A9D9IT29_9BACT|nr:outer membrane beta-barrel protein [Candidatus Cryptobacteroides excrementipullorum]
MKNTIMKIMVAAALLLGLSSYAEAQPGRRFYIDAGWQFNGVVGNDFATGGSGWGAYAEGGYYVLPRIAVGAFASFNTNNDYIPRQTYYYSDGSALTTDAVNSIYQVPFGATLRYRLGWKTFQPYAEAKLGANYAREYIYLPDGTARDSQWGFYVSPEVGFTWHPFHKNNLGFQFAVYYSYATNRSEAFSLNGINNVGFKLGLSF